MVQVQRLIFLISTKVQVDRQMPLREMETAIIVTFVWVY